MKRFKIIALIMAAVIAFSVFSAVTLADGSEPNTSTLTENTEKKEPSSGKQPDENNSSGNTTDAGNSSNNSEGNTPPTSNPAAPIATATATAPTVAPTTEPTLTSTPRQTESSATSTPAPTKNNKKTTNNNSKNSATVAPTPTPKPLQTYKTYTLSFAYHHVDEVDGVKYLYLSVDKIKKHFDDLCFTNIDTIKFYSYSDKEITPIEAEDGLIPLPLDDEKKYVWIEDEVERDIWAGTFEAKAYKLESGQYVCDIPHELAYYEESEETVDNDFGKVYLDLSEIIAEYGNVTVKAVHHSSKEYKLLDKFTDNGKYVYNTGAGDYDYYFKIQNDNKTFMWAGLIKAPSEGCNKTLIFHPFNDKTDSTISVFKVNSGFEDENEYQSSQAEITLEFADTPNYKAGTAKFVIECLNEKGEIVNQEFFDCDLSNLDNNQYPINYDGVTNDTVALKCALLIDESEVYAVVSEIDKDKIEQEISAQEPTQVVDDKLQITSVEKINVRIEDYSGVYDGKTHTASVTVPDSEDVTIWYAQKPEDGNQPDWQDDALEFTDAGEYTLLIRAEKDGCDFTYNGESYATGYAEVPISIAPKKVTITYRAIQDGKNIYTGAEQEIKYHYEIVDVTDEESDAENKENSLFKALKDDINEWLKGKEQTILKTDADNYPTSKLDDFYEDLNYAINWVYNDENSKVTIEKAKIKFELPKEYVLYGTKINWGDKPMISGSEDLEDEIIRENDYQYDQDNIPSNAGVYDIVVKLVNKVLDNSNLEVDNSSRFIIFPQSINCDDTSWEKADSIIQKYIENGIQEYIEDNDLPGFYNGIQIELKEAEVAYDGEPHTPVVVFYDKENSLLPLEEGKDYNVKYSVDSNIVDDCTRPGVYNVIITGINNYSGTVTEKFEITFDTGFKEIQDSLSYADLDSNAEGKVLSDPKSGINPTDYEWKDSDDNECNPPKNAGKYSVQAIWKNDDGKEMVRSNWYDVEIKAAKVTIQVSLNEKQEYVYKTDDDFELNENLIKIADGQFSYDNSGPNYEFVFENDEDVKRKLEEDGVTLTLNGWVYGGDANEPVIAGIDAEYKYTYYNSDGDKLDEKPIDAGTYTVTVRWTAASNIKCEKSAEFTIEPKVIEVSVADCEKTYGEADPNWHISVDSKEIEFENVPESDEYTIKPAGGEIKAAVERASGENVGEYEIKLTGEKDQGNYRVEYKSGKLTIEPKSINDFSATVIEGKPTLKDKDDNVLEDGKDYKCESTSSGVRFTGINNYKGERMVSNTLLSIDGELTLTAGENVLKDTASTDIKGVVSFEGSFTLNELPPESDKLKVSLNGSSDEIELVRVAETTEYRFSVKKDLATERTDSIEVTITYDSQSLISKTLEVRRKDRLALGLCATIIMMIGAAISGIVCVRLNKRLKRERYKLLDENSRQSSRTIREQD